jgi:site-specific DNA-methyltransferase (adenine-specific)
MPEVLRGDSFEVLARPEYLGVLDLVIADPPYGSAVLSEEWDKTSDYEQLGHLLGRVLKDGATAYVWGGTGKPKSRPFFKWLAHVEDETPLTLHNLITWSKKRAYGTPHNYLYTREECAMLVKGERPKTFHIPLLDQKRGYAGFDKDHPAKSEFLRRTNVWTDITEIFQGKIHPAEKPSRLAEIMIATSSNPGEFIVDPFAGSGSTGLAALKFPDRRCLLIEKSNCPMHSLEPPAQTQLFDL